MSKCKKTIASIGLSIFCALALVSCNPSKESSSAAKIQLGDIVNGTPVTTVDSSAHSIIAIIGDDGSGQQSLCTGTIISSSIVLTAAHCIGKDTKHLYIVFGFDVSKADPSSVRAVDVFIQHPDWNHDLPSGHGDIALMHFVGGIPSDYVPAKLADSKFELYQGQKVFMIGYGVTNGIIKAGSGVLRKTTSYVMSEYSATEVVTDGREKSICFGDSGGPAFVEVNKALVQWGIAQSVLGDCNNASIHTEVMPYLDWIKASSDKLEKLSQTIKD